MNDLATQIRDYLEETTSPVDPSQAAARSLQPARLPDRFGGWKLATAAAVLVGAVIGIPPLLLQRSEPGIEVPPLAAETAPDGLVAVDAGLGDGVMLTRSGDTLWASDAQRRIAGYRDGTWQLLPELPDPAPGPYAWFVVDVAGTVDGEVWAITAADPSVAAPDPTAGDDPPDGTVVWRFDGTGWTRFGVDDPAVSDDLDNVAVDPMTGEVWLSAPGGPLIRWGGAAITGVWETPDEMVVDQIAVTADGSVWASRFNPVLAPGPAGLAEFSPATGAWESADPLGDGVPGPVLLAGAPDPWVVVAEVEQWPPPSSSGSSYPATWVLAHFDSVSGEWTTSPIPSGEVRHLAADDGTVWIGLSEEGVHRLLRFDGTTWNEYPLQGPLDDLAVGNDGTVWLSIHGAGTLYRLAAEPEPLP